MSKQENQLYEFGEFRLDVSEQLLLHRGRPMTLTPKAFSTLALLVEQGGRLVDKEELINRLWPDTVVEENSLNKYVSAIRKTLREADPRQTYIETVPKRGYRFVAPVNKLAGEDVELVIEKYTSTHLIAQEEVEEAGQVQGTEPVAVKLQCKAQTRKSAGLRPVLLLSLAALALILPVVFLLRFSNTGRAKNADSSASVKPPLRSIAILPFKSLNAEGDKEYLGLGLADALIARLGGARQIIVRPTSAVRRYKDVNQDPVGIGRQLGVDAVLDGDYLFDGTKLRLNVQLIRVADGAMLWSRQFDEQFRDIFSVQDAISEQVACDLVTQICDKEGAHAEKQREIKIEAYEAYLKGRYFWSKRDSDGVKKAIEYFNQAIAIQPDYAAAHAALGGAYMFGTFFGMSPAEANAKGRAATLKALDLDPDLADAHANLGLISLNYDWDWATAERELKRALELNANSAITHDWYAEYLAGQGRTEEAVTEMERARTLDPLSVIINSDKCKMLYYAHRYNEAIEQCKRTLELDPTFTQALSWLAESYWEMGAREESQAANYEKLASTQNPYQRLAVEALIDIQAGKTAEARKRIRQLEQPAKTGEYEPGQIALFYILLGDKDRAFDWLDKAYTLRSTYVVALKSHPILGNLSSDPRYADLLRRAGLPQ